LFLHLLCRNPTLGLSVRMQLTLPKVRKWSHPGLPKIQKTIWGVKSPCIGEFFIPMEVLKRRCPKWPRMGHLDICSPSYGQKEGPGVKLAVWLPTTKSRESTFFRCCLKECDMVLESSRQELQLWFKARLDPSLRRRAMSVQSPGTPTRDNFCCNPSLGLVTKVKWLARVWTKRKPESQSKKKKPRSHITNFREC
jgi:hypothetical protein